MSIPNNSDFHHGLLDLPHAALADLGGDGIGATTTSSTISGSPTAVVRSPGSSCGTVSWSEHPADVGLREILRDRFYLRARVVSLLERGHASYDDDQLRYAGDLYQAITATEIGDLLDRDVAVVVAHHGGEESRSKKIDGIMTRAFDRVCTPTTVTCVGLDSDLNRGGLAEQNFLADGHWSARGHEQVARTLGRVLQPDAGLTLVASVHHRVNGGSDRGKRAGGQSSAPAWVLSTRRRWNGPSEVERGPRASRRHGTTRSSPPRRMRFHIPMPVWGIWSDARFLFGTGPTRERPETSARVRTPSFTSSRAEVLVVEGSAREISDERIGGNPIQ